MVIFAEHDLNTEQRIGTVGMGSRNGVWDRQRATGRVRQRQSEAFRFKNQILSISCERVPRYPSRTANFLERSLVLNGNGNRIP